MESKKVSVKDLTVLGMLSGIIVLLAYTPIGLIPLGPISASTIHIPVIVGAMILGPKKGIALGTVMGTISFIRALTAPGWLDQLFRNPLVSILPRVFIGVAAYYMYRWIKDVSQKDTIAYIMGSIAGSLTNTILTLGALTIATTFAFPDKLQEVVALVVTIVSTSGLVEAIGTGLIVPPIVYALKKLRY
ncbi:ECF transporter S component [Cellulosilyticum sp. I15G10I2]|uniref:ECF transporter S component n=1 Tax=Cellulosilyticum sp. I15G10I2 TaxID=1892843 RepID=UPI00085C56FE|nr:ECF transporter S component [Cellulosilyticum sp. I15G10I2]